MFELFLKSVKSFKYSPLRFVSCGVNICRRRFKISADSGWQRITIQSFHRNTVDCSCSFGFSRARLRTPKPVVSYRILNFVKLWLHRGLLRYF